MKKSVLLFGLMGAMSFGCASAQSKISNAGRMELELRASSPQLRSGDAKAREVSLIVTLVPGATADVLAEAGCVIVSAIDNMAIVRTDMSNVSALADLDEVQAIELPTEARTFLDKARELTKVDAVNNGTGDGLSGTAYTGKNVTVGLYDTGLDPNHNAFRNPDGSTRVKGVFVRKDDAPDRDITDPAQILQFDTEDNTQSHGTHVLGIMAGGRGINGTYATSATSGPVNGEIPYYGPAYDADIVIGCGSFSNNCILAGIEKVVNYANELGKPAVVNLSLGNNAGAHHPLSATGRFIDKLGEKAIICIAAGNEGLRPIAVSNKFSARTAELSTFMVPQNSPTGMISFTAEFWSDTADPFEADIVIYDKLSGSIVDKVTVKSSTVGFTTSSSSTLNAQYTSSSYISGNAGVDANTGLYNCYLLGKLQAKTSPTSYVGVNIRGVNGTTVYGWVNTLPDSADDAIFSASNVKGYKDGSCDGTINGFGCGYNIISVGAYTSRASAPYIDGGNYTAGGTIGAIAPFSSYGMTLDGRRLPHVAAPGAQVVSAINTSWANNSGLNTGKTTNAMVTANNRTCYYYPMQGTSMASPFAAGVIALWLDANPNLKVEDVQDIIEKTSIRDAQVNNSTGDNPKRWGAGKIDALAGIKLALAKGSLQGVSADLSEKNLVIENLGAGVYELTFVGAQKIDAGVYSVSGSKVLSAGAEGESVTIDTSALPSGVYVVAVDTPAGRVSKKLAIR